MCQSIHYKLLIHSTLYLKPSDGLWGSMVEGNENQWNGMVGALMKKSVDLCSVDMAFTPKRSEVIRFGTAQSMSKMSIVTKSLPAHQNMDFKAFIHIFRAGPWLTCFSYLLVLSIIMTAVNVIFCRGNNMMENIGSVYAYSLQRGEIRATQGVKGEFTLKIMTITALFTLFVLFNFYTAFLTSLMSANGDVRSFNKFEDLIDHGFSIITVKSFFLRDVLIESAEKHTDIAYLVEKMDADKDYVEGLHEIPRRLFNSKSAIVLNQEVARDMGDTIHFHSALSHLFQWEVTGFTYPIDSEFAGCFNFHINKFKENGLIEHILKKWSSSRSGRVPQTMSHDVETPFAINLHNVAFLVLVLVVGCGISVTLCLLEYLVVYWL